MRFTQVGLLFIIVNIDSFIYVITSAFVHFIKHFHT